MIVWNLKICMSRIQVMMKKINYWRGFSGGHYIDEPKEFPKGSIKKLIGRKFTWNDEPVELKSI